MSYETTLFAHIAPRFTNHIEDVAVEALGFILSYSPAARRALADTLKDGGIEVGSIDRVETWEIGEEGEIPDLVCFDKNGAKQVLIEAKFWADLTKNQPNQYLKQMQQDRPDGCAALLFVAPKTRLELLWPELCGRAKEEFELTTILESGTVRSASIGGDIHHLQLTSWATLLERMTNEANDAAADIKQLRGLTDRMDGDAFLPFRQEDLASVHAQQMLYVAQLVDDATDRAKERGFVNTDGVIAVPKRRGYGRFISIGGVGTWFGVHFPAWARHSDTPLWLSFHEDNREHLERSALIDDSVEIEGRFCIPLKLPDAVQYNEVLNFVVNSLERVAKQLDSSCPGTSERVDSDFFRPWLQKDLGPEFAERILGVAQLIDDAARHSTSRAEKDTRKWASTDGLKKIIQPRRTGYGRFILIGGVRAWFGIHFGGWARHRDAPLWLSFDYYEKPKLANLTDDVFEIDWKYCIPIELPITVDYEEVFDSEVDSSTETAVRNDREEYDAVLDSVVNSLKNIADKLDPPGTSHSVETDED